MNILFLTTVFPYSKKTGGEIVTSQYINVLREHHSVNVVAYQRKNSLIEIHKEDVVVGERIIESSQSKYWMIIWLIFAYIKGRTFSSEKYYSINYCLIINNLIKVNSYDLVIIDHSQLSWTIDIINQKIPIIFSSHNVEYQLYKELAEQNNYLRKFIYLREYRLMIREELKLLSNSQQVWVLSQSDKKEFYNLYKINNINVMEVPAGFERLLNCKLKYDVGILGTWTWASNKKGINWFFKKILPKINDNCQIYIGGKGSQALCKYENNNVHCLGFVDDAQIFLSSCKIIVIPTIAGGGIQIKTLDAISTNRPIVTTSIGVRGIENIPNSVIIESEGENFAKKINFLFDKNIENNLGFDWSVNRKNNFSTQINNYLKEINE